MKPCVENQLLTGEGPGLGKRTGPLTLGRMPPCASPPSSTGGSWGAWVAVSREGPVASEECAMRVGRGWVAATPVVSWHGPAVPAPSPLSPRRLGPRTPLPFRNSADQFPVVDRLDPWPQAALRALYSRPCLPGRAHLPHSFLCPHCSQPGRPQPCVWHACRATSALSLSPSRAFLVLRARPSLGRCPACHSEGTPLSLKFP